MDGLIFLRGAFIDSSIKKIALYAENANKVVNVVAINSMDDVNKYMKDNKVSKMLVHKIECDNGAVRVYCYMKQAAYVEKDYGMPNKQKRRNKNELFKL